MIRYRTANRKHKICKGKPPEILHPRMTKFWKKHELSACDGAILAYHKKNLIGFFRYYKRKKSVYLYAAGTYILPAYRGDGVAKKLWVKALKKCKPEYVDVVIASRGGMKLVNSLKKKFKKINWIVSKL